MGATDAKLKFRDGNGRDIGEMPRAGLCGMLECSWRRAARAPEESWQTFVKRCPWYNPDCVLVEKPEPPLMRRFDWNIRMRGKYI